MIVQVHVDSGSSQTILNDKIIKLKEKDYISIFKVLSDIIFFLKEKKKIEGLKLKHVKIKIYLT